MGNALGATLPASFEPRPPPNCLGYPRGCPSKETLGASVLPSVREFQPCAAVIAARSCAAESNRSACAVWLKPVGSIVGLPERQKAPWVPRQALAGRPAVFPTLCHGPVRRALCTQRERQSAFFSLSVLPREIILERRRWREFHPPNAPYSAPIIFSLRLEVGPGGAITPSAAGLCWSRKPDI